MIITVIEDIASYLSLSFYHGRDDFQNLNADEESLPALYLDTPLRNSYAIAQSGYISDTFDVSLVFMYKSELDWTPEQHDTNCIQLAEEKIREFLVYCQDNDNIEEITNINGLEFINLFDTNVSGKILNLTIKLYNTYSVCKPVCEGVTLLINGTELNYLSGQTTTLAVTLDGTPSGTYNETTNTWEVESEPCPPSEIDITFDTIPLGTATTSPYNIDCSTLIDVAVISGNATFNGVYVANGTEHGQTRYTHTTNANLRIRGGAAWQVVNSVGVTITEDTPSGFEYPWEASWDVNFTMVQGTISDYCGGGVCADATIENSDASYTNTVASGGTLVLADTTYNVYVNGVLDQTVSVPTLKNETINITP